MNNVLLNTILSMDAYNRGYNAGISLPLQDTNAQNSRIDGVQILFDSSVLGVGVDQSASFYAIAYEDTNGNVTVSYRGTDSIVGSPNIWGDGDFINGWFVGTGDKEAKQAEFAIRFFQDVVESQDPANFNYFTNSVSLTGHSLGGGLAGLVGGLYHRPAEIFDNMPFEKVIQNIVVSSSDINHPDHNPELKDLIYAGLVVSDDTSQVNATSINGESLEFFRSLQSVPDNQIKLYDSIGSNDFTSVQLHSVSSLAIRLFADVGGIGETSLATDWQVAAPYFWNVMYDGAFARDIGMFNVAGRLTTEAIDDPTNKVDNYADILRQVIAYSAIDGSEGVTVFGDTGIRALYDDANDLGNALGDSTALETYATDISKAFVQFAGTLALNKIEQVNFADAINGVLTYSPDALNNTLTVDFSDELWTKANSDVEVPPMIALSSLIDTVLFTDPAEETLFRGYMQQLWGDDTTNVFDRIVFALTDTGTTNVSDNNDLNAKTTLVVSGGGDQTLNGSNVDDFIYGGDGADTLYGNDGVDLLYGGLGNDRLYGGQGNDYFVGAEGGKDNIYGEDGVDTVSYVDANSRIFANFSSYAYISVNQADGTRNTLRTIEKIEGTAYDDGFTVRSGTGVEEVLAGNGNDVFLVKSGELESIVLDGGAGVDEVYFEGLSESDFVRSDGLSTIYTNILDS